VVVEKESSRVEAVERPEEIGHDYAHKACSLSDNHPFYLDTLAVVYAERGIFLAAVREQRKALESPDAFSKEELKKARMRLELYLQNKPYREP